MTTIFYGTTKCNGLHGDSASVTHIDGRVLVRAVDPVAEEAVTVAFNPTQARELAAAIVAVADAVEGEE